MANTASSLAIKISRAGSLQFNRKMSKLPKTLISAGLILIFALFPFEAKAIAPLVIAAGLALIPLLLGIIGLVISSGVFISIVGGVHFLSGKLITSGINFQTALLNPEKITAIQAVWTILRDFVNIFFILILLTIAFATIFNIKNYKASDLLPKLIIAALLINFSLVIAAWTIDLLWIPAAVFLRPLGPDIGGQIANVLDIQKFFDPGFIAAVFTGGYSETIEWIFRGILFIVEAFIFSWIAFIIWARIPVLIGLMIVSPIAWLGLTLPAIRKQSWDAWWQKLFCWGSIPIPLFGLIYFVILFNQRLNAEIVQAVPSSVLNTVLSFIGFNTGQAIVWIITAGIFLAGLNYIKGLSCSLYGWVMAGWTGTWKGIRRGVGATVDFGYMATGAAGAVKGAKGRMLEEGIPLFGKQRFGAAQLRLREATGEDWLSKQAGLPSRLREQTTTMDQAEKAAKDVENRIKVAKDENELTRIIDELKERITKGAKDPETLAAINVLAKRGELDVNLFNQAVNNFKDMPLALSRVMSEWKEGKFGGLTIPEFLRTMRDEDETGKKLDRLPLEVRRIMYNFAASDDAKKIVEKMEARDYKEGYEMISLRDRRDFSKKIGGARPELKAQYVFEVKNLRDEDKPKHSAYDDWQKMAKGFREFTKETEGAGREREPQNIEDVLFMDIKDGSVKDLAGINSDSWKVEPVKKAIKRTFEERERRSPGSGANLKVRLERKLIDEGSFDQIRVLHEQTPGIGRQGRETE